MAASGIDAVGPPGRPKRGLRSCGLRPPLPLEDSTIGTGRSEARSDAWYWAYGFVLIAPWRYGWRALMGAGHDRRGVAINVKFSGEGSVKGEVTPL